MLDIYSGIVIMIFVSILFFWFTVIVSSKFPRRVADVFAVFALLGMILYIRYLWDKAEISWFVPYSNAIILGNWFPVITAILSALVYHRIPGEKFRKYGMVTLLNLVGIYALFQPIVGITPECKNQIDEFGIARQSSQVSCSPTSAVNLLAYYGIKTTESEMSALCLTKTKRSWLGFQLDDGGTSWMGLYRGLKLKLSGSKFEPRFFSLTFEEFTEDPRGPVIVSLMLDPSLEKKNPRQYERLRFLGWRPGLEHNVVFVEMSDWSVSIVDPEVGYEEMTPDEFEALWVGRGIFLETH
ncbi:MAG: hypothetical protein VX438_00715 [Planctomycetota bacterium]|jgi:hypothetical protein|nr:hypothetical protein [Planctomycetota bacterium]